MQRERSKTRRFQPSQEEEVDDDESDSESEQLVRSGGASLADDGENIIMATVEPYNGSPTVGSNGKRLQEYESDESEETGKGQEYEEEGSGATTDAATSEEE